MSVASSRSFSVTDFAFSTFLMIPTDNESDAPTSAELRLKFSKLEKQFSCLMVLKRSLTEEGNDSSYAPTQKQSTGQKFRTVDEYDKRDDFLQEIVEKCEPLVRSVVQQVLEEKLGLLQSFQRCFPINQPESRTSRTFQLSFTNKLPSTVFTNSRIHAEGHCLLTVQLIDSNSSEVINYDPFGSAKIEVFVLGGDFALDGQEDWSRKAFANGIVRERDGKRPLLVGELSLSLTHGVGSIRNILFTDNSSWVRSRKFKLGVRAVPNTLNGIGIKEGISEAFVVLDHRGESYQKHDIPCLDDPVWRLRKISKNGAIHRKLAEKGIYSVKEFLQLYHMNPNLLKDILGSGVANKAWQTMVKHANTCCLDDNRYAYYHAASGLGLLLNSVYKVVGFSFDGVNPYQSIDTLNMQQMVLVEKLKQYIYHNLSVLCPANDFVSGPSLDQWGSGFPITDQDISGSNPYMADGSYQLEEEATAHSHQSYEGAICWGSSSQLFNEGNSVDSMVMTLPSTPLLMGEHFPPQPSIWQPIVTTWATASSSDMQFSSPLHSFGTNLSGGGKPRAHWGKIRALLMWKIVKRDADAKKKGKFPSCYYQSQVA